MILGCFFPVSILKSVFKWGSDGSLSGSTMKKKSNLWELYLLLWEIFYLKCNPKFFYVQKKNIFLWKVYRCFGLTLRVLYQFFESQKSQITWKRSWVTQMIKVYILWRILYWLTSWFSLQDSARSTNRVRLILSRCAFRKN